MPVERAIWYPYWYELDQPIAVGQVGEFDFFHKHPESLRDETSAIFFHGDWSDASKYYSSKKLILAIYHPRFGAINNINTSGLDYTITLADGTEYRVEAEESPGKVYKLAESITDWRVQVEMESIKRE